ncbi:MAG: hypothetical protein ACREP9_08140, partial [Candidatus Dormibacteraceae bacterium]
MLGSRPNPGDDLSRVGKISGNRRCPPGSGTFAKEMCSGRGANTVLGDEWLALIRKQRWGYTGGSHFTDASNVGDREILSLENGGEKNEITVTEGILRTSYLCPTRRRR